MKRSGTQGRKLGARVSASGLQQWKPQAPGKGTNSERHGESKTIREGRRTRGRDAEKAEIRKTRGRHSKRHREKEQETEVKVGEAEKQNNVEKEKETDNAQKTL